MPADFRVLTTARQLAFVTSTADAVLSTFLAAPEKHVRRISIPRRDRTHRPREAWEVTTTDVSSFLGSLRMHFDAFLRHQFPSAYPHPAVHGYVQGRSALSNARAHVGRLHLLKADVRDFFPSITRDAVKLALLSLQFRPAGAELMSSFVTLNGALPLGYSTSPLFSNVVLLDVDRQLDELARSCGAQYSRYADDLTFSSDEELPSLAAVGDVLRTVGLELHPMKCSFRRRGQPLYVTGYSVTDSVARAPRAMKRELRQTLHFVRTRGLADHVAWVKTNSITAEHDRIVGQVEHVRHAEPRIGARLLHAWNERDKRLDGRLVRSPRTKARARKILVDDTEFDCLGVKYRALGAVVVQEAAAARERIMELADDLLLHPLMNERGRAKIRAFGIHYTDLAPDFRLRAVEMAAVLRLRAHVVFAASSGTKDAQFATLIRSALKWRLQDCAGDLVTVDFEEGPYISPATAVKLVAEASSSLPLANRPLRIEEVRVVKKAQEPCVALADIFLGVWQQFARSRDDRYAAHFERNEMLFRSTQRQFGTIYDLDTGRLFTQKTPFAAFSAT